MGGRGERQWWRGRVVFVLLLPWAAGCAGVPAKPATETPPTSTQAPAQEVLAGRSLAPSAPRVTAAPDEPATVVAGAPSRVIVPRLGVDAPVVPITAPGGVLTPPGDPATLGWWSDGAVPGAGRGSALVTGHTVHTGGGALDDLEELADGDRVEVATPQGALGYVVTRTEVLGKGELAQRAEALFDQSVPGRLVLITCEDWNGSEYLSNVVVTASPMA